MNLWILNSLRNHKNSFHILSLTKYGKKCLANTVKLGYNDHSYNEFILMTSKILLNFLFQMTIFNLHFARLQRTRYKHEILETEFSNSNIEIFKIFLRKIFRWMKFSKRKPEFHKVNKFFWSILRDCHLIGKWNKFRT